VTSPQPDPAAQAKALKSAAVYTGLGGLIVGVGVPVTFVVLGIQVFMTPWGFDAIWLVPLAFMVFDFIMARVFWRRAAALERSAQGLPPQT
jgi:Na+-driven multidrug efflux pump